ncbi:MAG: DUF6383 domain-containing protein [Tannerella sp.]|jgi:hypothetical protein|nr:DUF6383 domain-containing protein [Tannerella sp.]
MDRKITVWHMIVLGMFFICPVSATPVLVEKPIFDSVYYYLKIDTAEVDLGYLRIDTAESTLSAATSDIGVDAMWRIIETEYSPDAPGTGSEYRFVNVATSDTLRFSLVTTQPDTIAVITENGILSYWFDLVFNEGGRNEFKTLYEDGQGDTLIYYLTVDGEGVVMLSSETSVQTHLNFSVERIKRMPDLNRYYRLKADTLGMPGVASIGYFSVADTTIRRDSLSVYKTLRGDLSLWKLTVDTMVYDTTYFKIYNKATDSDLAFDIPSVDTVACMRQQGALNQWMLPFFVEDNGVGKFLVRDTLANKDYYLALKDTIVMLVSDTMAYQCLKFVVEEDFLVDTTLVYKVKYLNGTDSGSYLGANARGERTLLDTVYAHYPDGQFVVYRENKYTLMNRSGKDVTTGWMNVTTDSLSVVCDALGDTLLFQYTNDKDTFEITPITYGGIETEMFNPYLGYRYLQPEDLRLSAYVFSYTSADTLNGRVLGYTPADSLVMLLPDGDTAQFVLDVSRVYSEGAPEIAGIPRTKRNAYHLRAFNDTTLYLSIRANDSLRVDTVPRQASFFLKEDTIPASGKYYFLENAFVGRKALVDSTKYFYMAPADTVVIHLFSMIWRDRYPPEEDPYEYLTYDELTEIYSGIGLYEIANMEGREITYLTKNYYDYAYFGMEGGSTFVPPVQTRAGSYIRSDFHLWIDTARAKGYNPERPSFYIIRDIDTISAGSSKYNMSGYFLHVMDSLSGQEDSKIIDDTGVGEYEYNRVNFVKARRYSANELLLNFGLDEQERTERDSVGFRGKNELAINEYRFYLQKTGTSDDPQEYYIVTEQGYGVTPGTRAYLSSTLNGRLYVGPRNNSAKTVTISVANHVANEVVPPSAPEPEEISKKITIVGEDGHVTVYNASGERVTIFNVLGQKIGDKIIFSDKETVPVPRGILIVKVGESKTQKVVVK